MVAFEDIISSEFLQIVYKVAIAQAEVKKRLETNQGALKVLDQGGGRGGLGAVLLEQFGPSVEYTNVDSDEEALQHSVGRTILGDYTELPELLDGEKFDYVFALNTVTLHPELTEDTYSQMRGEEKEESHISSFKQFDYERRLIHDAISMLSAILTLKEHGRFITSGGFYDATEIEDFLGNRGLNIANQIGIDMGEENARRYVDIDIQHTGQHTVSTPSQFDIDQAVSMYRRDYRIFAIDKTKSKYTDLTSELEESRQEFSERDSLLKQVKQRWPG